MDALAAYGSDSDDSGSESVSASTSNRPSPSTSGSAGTATSGSKISSLSSMLPPPKSQTPSSSTAAATKAPSASASAPTQPKTSKYHSLPTLEPDSDSDEEESVFRKKAKLAEAAKTAGSGVGALFAMLPAPKSTPSSSASEKPATAKPTFMPRTVKKPGAPAKKPAPSTAQEAKDGKEGDDDDDDDDEAPLSFFPLGAAATATPSTGLKGKTASNTFIPLFFDKKPLTTEEQQAQNQEEVDVSLTNEQYSYGGNEQYAYNDQYAYQSNEAYAYGADAYTQYEQETPTASHGANAIELDDVGHLKPTATLKRKHNILSLAYEAKANESHLNASWAASRKTKAETQAKYGF
ncbi:hypothetical protein BGX31_004463 [Mortierella sp. GBA43]|nr:hypothetical protein BGX31_004463 [Mortierella sp. GBA43]